MPMASIRRGESEGDWHESGDGDKAGNVIKKPPMGCCFGLAATAQSSIIIERKSATCFHSEVN